MANATRVNSVSYFIPTPVDGRQKDMTCLSDNQKADKATNSSRYILGERIGSGTFGSVYLAKGSAHLVIKVLDKFDRDRDVSMQEVRVHANLDHPNVIKFVDFLVSGNNQHGILMERVDGFALSAFKANADKATAENEAIPIFRQLVEGLGYLYEKRVLHRDFKSDNIMLDQTKTVKILDFGLSVELDTQKKHKGFCGTPEYASPESFKGEYDFKTDVWSAGVVLFRMLTNSLPFQGRDALQIQRKFAEPLKFDGFSTQCSSLMLKVLELDPIKRASVLDIKRDPWLQQNTTE